jgi:DnaK suppressor protein
LNKPPAKAATAVKTAVGTEHAVSAAPALAKPAAKATAPKVGAAAAVDAGAPAAKPAAKAATPKASAAAAVAAPAPVSNRFTDRFAPAPRPAARPAIEAADFPKPHKKVDPRLTNAWKSKSGRELTEEELLAMPEAEYMNEKQIDFFKSRLQQQKDDLLSNAGETTEHLREDTSIVPDPADRATIEEEHALELRTRDRERKLLKKISQSLARLESGEYGYCDETGEPIGLARLLARPTATLSLEAQQRRELKQKMFGD